MATLMLCGCNKDTQGLDEKEERNPLIRTGQAYMEIKNWNKAETAFKQAIENKPTMARPHLDLALIYQQYKLNYIHAIYHYDRYLELRPNAEKAGFIKEQREKVEQALAVQYIQQSKGVGQVELKQLQQENSELKRQLAALHKSTPAITATQLGSEAQKSVTETVPKSVTPVGKATHQIYTVVAGDNLTKIAKKFYGDGDYEAIYEANKDRMKSSGDLRIGQTLIIPNR
jgi:Tfp pilus assembly protein PilF